MSRIELISLGVLFALTVCSSILGNLKNILIVKDDGWKKYLVTALDTIFFALIVGTISTSTPRTVTVYTIGKLVGLGIADYIIKKTDSSIYLSNLYLDNKYLDSVSEYLFKGGISFTVFKGEFFVPVDDELISNERVSLSIHLNKRQMKDLKSKLTELGISEPTMDITVVKVSGNIVDRV